MRSTMMDVPLTVTAIMRHGTSAYPDSEVVSLTDTGSRRQTYAATGLRAAQLAPFLTAATHGSVLSIVVGVSCGSAAESPCGCASGAGLVACSSRQAAPLLNAWYKVLKLSRCGCGIIYGFLSKKWAGDEHPPEC